MLTTTIIYFHILQVESDVMKGWKRIGTVSGRARKDNFQAYGARFTLVAVDTSNHLADQRQFKSFVTLVQELKSSQELQMLSSVTINCQVAKIVMNPISQLSVL